MTYKLYYAPDSASMGVRLILEELGVAYELIQSTTDKTYNAPLSKFQSTPMVGYPF